MHIHANREAKWSTLEIQHRVWATANSASFPCLSRTCAGLTGGLMLETPFTICSISTTSIMLRVPIQSKNSKRRLMYRFVSIFFVQPSSHTVSLQGPKTNVLTSILSRPSASGRVLGSSKAVCANLPPFTVECSFRASLSKHSKRSLSEPVMPLK